MSAEQPAGKPHEVYCPTCRGGNPPQALYCRWCGISLSQPRSAATPPVYAAEQVYQNQQQDRQPAQQKSQSGCVAALTTFLIGSVALLVSVYIQSLFATSNTTPRPATVQSGKQLQLPTQTNANITNSSGTVRAWGTSASNVRTFTVTDRSGAYLVSVEAFKQGSVPTPTDNCPITAMLIKDAGIVRELVDGATINLTASEYTIEAVTACDWLVVLEYQDR